MTGYMLVARETLAAASSLAPSPPLPLTTKPLPSSHTPLSHQDFPSLSIHTQSRKPAFAASRVAATCASLCLSASLSESKEGAPDPGFPRKRLAVFVSGGGSNFRTLHQASLQNKIFGDFVLVVSDKPACKACDYAKGFNMPLAEYPRNKVADSGLSSAAELLSVLRQYQVDILLLAGYLKLLPKEVTQAYPRAILNIHPALLPAFGGKGYYGRKVHGAVIKSGARYSGPTVHFVDEKYDHGSIVAQRVVPVLPYDTADDLAARVLKEEHNLYPEVVAAICEDRIFWREDGVPLIRRSWDEAEYY